MYILHPPYSIFFWKRPIFKAKNNQEGQSDNRNIHYFVIRKADNGFVIFDSSSLYVPNRFFETNGFGMYRSNHPTGQFSPIEAAFHAIGRANLSNQSGLIY